MTDTSFNPGDLVQLKSGGPVMTLAAIHKPTPGQVVCEWFTGDEPRRQSFAIASLQAVVMATKPAARAPRHFR